MYANACEWHLFYIRKAIEKLVLTQREMSVNTHSLIQPVTKQCFLVDMFVWNLILYEPHTSYKEGPECIIVDGQKQLGRWQQI